VRSDGAHGTLQCGFGSFFIVRTASIENSMLRLWKTP
jgi:hypothetical protein